MASESNVERFGQLLRRFRMRAGLSQEQLAERARISVEATGALERGTRTSPQRKTLDLLIAALQLSSDEAALMERAAVRPVRPRERKPSVPASDVSFFQMPQAALTAFVGRAHDVAALLALLERSRLVTVVGSGGVGKTRLVTEIVPLAARHYPDGIFLVALSQVMPNAPVVPAIVSALRLHDEGVVPLEDRLRAAIGARRMLLILDNCEHVLDRAAPVVHDLLARCGNLRILATSRERLRIDGERVYRLNPLGLGDAVSVFIDRASAAGFDPESSDDDLATATEICERVDRIPLAIELAAANSTVFGYKAILARLQTHTLIAGGARTSVARHQSLDALVQWSYERLEPIEAEVFRGLAPFVGGCRLDDAQAILAFGNVSSDDVPHAILRLHDQSLLESNRAEEPRFSTLQTIRDFAAKQLGSGDERAGLLRRFATHYFDLATSLEAGLRSFDQAVAIERLSAEQPNIRVALGVLADDPSLHASGLAGLGALAHFWICSGGIAEGSELFSSLDFREFEESPGLAAALAGGAFLELNRQNARAGYAYAQRARTLAQTFGQSWLELYSAIAEHACAEMHPDLVLREPFEIVYRRIDALGEPWLICSAALRMGSLLTRTDPAAAITNYRRALDVSYLLGDVFMTGIIQLNMARALAAVDPAEAAQHVIAAWRDMAPAHSLGRARCIERLAEIAVALQRADAAAVLLGIALRTLADVGTDVLVHPQMRPTAATLRTTRPELVASGTTMETGDANARIETFIASLSAEARR